MKTGLVQRIRYPGGYWKVLSVTSQCKAGDKSLIMMGWKVKGKHSIETVIRDYLLEESGCEEKQKGRALKDISSQRRADSVRQKWPEHMHRWWRGRDLEMQERVSRGSRGTRIKSAEAEICILWGWDTLYLGSWKQDGITSNPLHFFFLSIRTERWRRAHLKMLLFQVAKARFKQLLRRERYRLCWWLRW